MASQPRVVYRVVSSKYPPFDGIGAHKHGSRWVDPGRFVVHATSTYSLAILENIVHWRTPRLIPSLVTVVATIPASLKQQTASIKKLEDQNACRNIGNEWYDKADCAVLWVPSIVSPYEQNVLLNQLHTDFSKIKIETPVKATIDNRLL